MGENMLPNASIRIRTPDGTMNVFIIENKDGTVNSFQIAIGKAGLPLGAWAQATAALMTLCIQRGASVDELMFTLSNISSDRTARTLESNCRSGPEGIWMALARYKKQADVILIEEEPHFRGASVGPSARVRSR